MFVANHVADNISMEKTTKDINSVFKLLKRMAFDWFLLLGIYVPFALIVMEAASHGRPLDGWTLMNAEGEYIGSRYSLSTMAWKKGHLWILAFYGIFLVTFVLYQAFLFIKLSGRKNHKSKKSIKYEIALLSLLACTCTVFVALTTLAYDTKKYDAALWILGIIMLLFTALLIIATVLYVRERRRDGRFDNKRYAFLKWTAIIGAAVFLVGAAIPVDDSIVNTGTQSLPDLLHTRLSQLGTGTLVSVSVIMAVIFCFEVKNKKNIPLILGPLAFLFGFGIFGLIEWWVASFFELWITFMGMVYFHFLTVNYEITERCSTSTAPSSPTKTTA